MTRDSYKGFGSRAPAAERGAPSMTRQHFALIAEVIAERRTVAHNYDDVVYDELDRISKAFASALASTNPNFNRARFLRACGVDDA